MSSDPEALWVDSRKVVDETVDGEVIIIHLERGNYFSLSGSGAEIWRLLRAGMPRDEITRALSDHFDAEPSVIDEAVRNLIGDLKDEALVEAGMGGVRNGDGAAPPGAEAVGGREAFEAPVLEKYTDMQDFLLIDPIHEVTEEGWPAVKPEA